MNYEEAIAYIHGMYYRGSKLGLVRVTELLKRLGDPQDELKFVHIAGTNGKGSTAAMTSSILVEAGFNTGLFISPFINRFNERIQLNNSPISDEDLAYFTGIVRDTAESMEDLPTEFEVITAVAMLYYKAKKCDIVVLEVGLGGERDSTNVIKTPELAIITAIGLDHTHILGETIEEIAHAKAGIIKPGGDVLIYGAEESAAAVFEAACREKGARLIKTDFSSLGLISYDLDYLTFSYGKYEALKLALLGSYQTYNAALVLTGIELLRERGYDISDEAVRRGLMNVRWPARFEVIKRDPIVIVDGGHNPHGIRGTVESIRRCFPGEKLPILMGVMADKAVDEMIEIIAPIASEFFTVTPDYSRRAMEAPQLAEAISRLGFKATAYESVDAGIEAMLLAAKDVGKCCAMGSLYMAGDVRAYFGKR